MKKPYIKKYCTIAHITVWLVNGNYIRTNIDEEFTNFALHHIKKFPYIPKNEFWIDHEAEEGEEQFFIDNMLAMHKHLSMGKSYKEAHAKADIVEKKERAGSKLVKKIKTSYNIKNIHKKLLKKYSNHIKVWIVKGELVRDLLFLDFTEGGHDFIYHFIPNNEIWLDDDITPKERKFILLHELYERYLMSKDSPYNEAHNKASHLEFSYRHNKKDIDKKIKEILKLNYFSN